MTTLETRIHFPEDVLFHEVGGEAVLLNLQTGKYFGLDDVGTRIWQRLQEHGALAPALRALLAEYEVEEERLQADLIELVDKLASHGLVQLGDTPAAAQGAQEPGEHG